MKQTTYCNTAKKAFQMEFFSALVHISSLVFGLFRYFIYLTAVFAIVANRNNSLIRGYKHKTLCRSLWSEKINNQARTD
jgi:hypothetical protein